MRQLVEQVVEMAWEVTNFSHEIARWRAELDEANRRTAYPRACFLQMSKSALASRPV